MFGFRDEPVLGGPMLNDYVGAAETYLDPMLTSKHDPMDVVPVMSLRQYHLGMETLLDELDRVRNYGQNDEGDASVLVNASFMVDVVRSIVVRHASMILAAYEKDAKDAAAAELAAEAGYAGD